MVKLLGLLSGKSNRPAGESTELWVPPTELPPSVEQRQSVAATRELGMWSPPPPPPVPPKCARLVFAVDATGSRSVQWEAAKRLTDKLLEAVPDGLEVALAVHGGGQVHTFTKFLTSAAELRDRAASVECRVGGTRLLQILDRVATMGNVGTVVYIGDCFEENERAAARLADRLRGKKTRVIILHDGPPLDAFAIITDGTGGALLPFDVSALDRLAELLKAVAVFAVGGADLVKEKEAELPAARVLLDNLDPKRLLIGRSTTS